MKPHHSIALIRDMAKVMGLILLLVLYGIGAQWLFETAPWVLGWYLIVSIPAAYIALAAFRVGSDEGDNGNG